MPSVMFPLDLLALFFYHYHDAGIAQLVECKLPKLEATGSIPVARSILNQIPIPPRRD
jgi:hypothetical protein